MVATDGATPLVPGSQTKLVTAKTRRGRRFLENRAPKAVRNSAEEGGMGWGGA